MEACLREELLKLKEDEVYCEVGANKPTLKLAYKVNKNIKIYAVDDCEDPCVGGTIYLQGKSRDLSEIWFHETDESFISVLLINKDFERNFKLWHDYVKPKGTILLNTTNFVDLNYKIERFENYLLIRL